MSNQTNRKMSLTFVPQITPPHHVHWIRRVPRHHLQRDPNQLRRRHCRRHCLLLPRRQQGQTYPHQQLGLSKMLVNAWVHVHASPSLSLYYLFLPYSVQKKRKGLAPRIVPVSVRSEVRSRVPCAPYMDEMLPKSVLVDVLVDAAAGIGVMVPVFVHVPE